MLKKLAPYTRGYRWYILLGVLCSVGEAVLELELPQAMSAIVDVGIANGDRSYILAAGLKMVIMALLALGCGVGAAALAAKDSEGRNGMVLQGPGGYLVVEGGTNGLPVVYSVLGGVRGGGTRVDGPKPERHRMAYEFAEFARIIAEKDADAEAAARMRTMRVMELLDVLHKQ